MLVAVAGRLQQLTQGRCVVGQVNHMAAGSLLAALVAQSCMPSSCARVGPACLTDLC